METEFNWTAPKKTRTSKARQDYLLRYKVNGKYYRIRSGHAVGRPDLVPNSNKGAVADKMWSALAAELIKFLERGVNPLEVQVKRRIAESGLTLGEIFKSVLSQKINTQISETHKRDIKNSGEQFLEYLKEENMFDMVPEDFTTHMAQIYMDRFSNLSETTYNNKKRRIATVFAYACERKYFKKNPFEGIKLKKQVEKRNVPFTQEQILRLIKLMDEMNYDKLKLCAYMLYYAFLRPHEEVRLLKRKDFNEDFTIIRLSGSRMKNKRNRTVPVHPEIKDLLLSMNIYQLEPNANIFTGTETPPNTYYFNTAWGRLKKKDQELSEDPKNLHSQILQEDQTLYSFRHTGAIAHYRRFQDISTLRKSMDHSTLVQTEKYLRGLDLLHSSKNMMPPSFSQDKDLMTQDSENSEYISFKIPSYWDDEPKK